MIRLLALVPKPTGLSPGQRFRLEQWAPRLLAHGISIDFEPFESPKLTQILYQPGKKLEKAVWILRDTWRRREAVRLAKGYDGVIIYREAALLGPAVYERILARAKAPIFFDFDDAIWLPQDSTVNGVFSKLHFWGKTSTICKLSRAVLVGNEYLAEYARDRNQNVFVVPTSIDLRRYAVQPPLASDDPLVIGWSGSTHTLVHLEVARPFLERLARKRKIVVRVICNKPPSRPIAGAENVFVPWKEENEAQDIGAAHVGIMPLPDDVFARGKCGLKALQYMATGRPVVISPVGVNKEIVRSGENGIHASTDDEWIAALERLADPALRTKIGAAARRTVEERYSADVVAAKFASAIKTSLDAN
jgi:glycosyltransferase involved in cell wall biosynthesis